MSADGCDKQLLVDALQVLRAFCTHSLSATDTKWNLSANNAATIWSSGPVKPRGAQFITFDTVPAHIIL